MIKQEVLFSPEECQRIKNSISTIYPPVEDVNWWSSHKINYRFRNKQEYIITDPTSLNFVKERVESLGIIQIPDYKVIHYGKGGYFAPHIDAGRNHPIRRKTLLVQLSYDEDYQGGDMYVKDVLFKKEIGNTILFDSSLTHELKVVEGGNRFVMVSWLSIYNLTQNKSAI